MTNERKGGAVKELIREGRDEFLREKFHQCGSTVETLLAMRQFDAAMLAGVTALIARKLRETPREELPHD